MKVVVLAGFARSLVNFRGPLLEAMVAHGHDVTAVAPEDDGRVAEELERLGVRFRAVPMQRTGIDPVADAGYFWRLLRLLRRERPDVVLAYTIKPVVYGMMAAHAAGVPVRAALVTGLGYAFGSGGAKQRIVGWLARRLYRRALASATVVLFQNPDDRHEFTASGLVDADKTRVVAGSGVPLDRFRQVDPPAGPPVFLLIARLIRAKGVEEFAAAARIVRETHPEARFQLLGPFDATPDAVPEETVRRWEAEGIVEHLGRTDDVRPFLASCSVFVLPSYYREGTPRSALEALAVGRAIVTTDAPGCRETVVPGTNGFLVEPRDPQALADALRRFVEDPELVATMGRASRELAERRYDVNLVNAAMLSAMRLADGSETAQTP